MFLRSTVRKKDGKEHEYFSIVENNTTGSYNTSDPSGFESRAEGRTMSTLAEQWKLRQTQMVQIKTTLVTKMRDYFGDDIWQVLAEQPQWKVNLMATRHYLTCQFERNAGTIVCRQTQTQINALCLLLPS